MKKFDFLIYIIKSIEDIVLISSDDDSFGFDFENYDEYVDISIQGSQKFEKIFFEDNEFYNQLEYKLVIYKIYITENNIIELFKKYDFIKRNKDKIIDYCLTIGNNKIIKIISKLNSIYPEKFI